MKRLTIEQLGEILDRYIIPARTLFPLCSESLAPFFSRITGEGISECDAIDALSGIGYTPLVSNDMPWTESYNKPAWFKICFVRDEKTIGLFDFFDSGLCSSVYLKRIIFNAKENENKRILAFCRSICTDMEMCRQNMTDDDVAEYLLWLSGHCPSPKSTFAALVLCYLDNKYSDSVSADQLQFMRENPDIILM